MGSSQGAAAAILDEHGCLLLVKENYDRRRYTLVGGAVEIGESPLETVVREAREEACIEIDIDHIVGIYRLIAGAVVVVFRASIESGTPAVPETGEVAGVGWFAPDEIPQPRSNLLHHAREDIVTGRRGVVRLGLTRIN